MPSKYKQNIGRNGEIISVDPDEVIAISRTVDFSLSVSPGSYAAEKLISDYINKLFETINSAREQWESAINVASQYARQVDEVPNPKAPQNTDVFD